MPRGMTPRPKTPYPAEGTSLLRALWEVTVVSQWRFWAKANPITFVGHILYHVGFYAAVGMYTFATGVYLSRNSFESPSKTVPLVFGWFEHTQDIFGESGRLVSVGGMMTPLFVAALFSATIGMAIPFVMSALKKRGMIIPLDNVVKAAGIRVDGLPRNRVGWSRKAIGLIVLVMDGAMLLTFLSPVPRDYAYIIHVSFGLTIVSLFPFTFLFHEIARWRAWGAVKRRAEGRIA
ncbi:MAG: hypothetical protein A2172_01140 [Candidatus Woykebacteria bacterium RBG_13_40_15]|uniref:Uncharacterized protein n=1 Tax=Candidatus Woykebacteria bacterium RBG_13_40_15 TaxID=1802593 RepID=A0A1G1W8Y5_9BACT|nr:MAG: hypothetical protein A2172_01140 [Candidatus Woykebacteria bacterium RBG_13_40_15]